MTDGYRSSYVAVCQVDLQVVLLTSTKTQIPFDYYRAPYCRESKITKEAENLGEVRVCSGAHEHYRGRRSHIVGYVFEASRIAGAHNSLAVRVFVAVQSRVSMLPAE